MTAEVVVMNKLAVALAADSAATVATRNKVFNGAEKLFSLIPGHSVGFMVYNHPEFMQIPWGTIVKKYRKLFGDKSFKTLQEYANDFISFLSQPDNALYSDVQYEITFRSVINFYLGNISKLIISDVKINIENKAKRISLREIKQIITRRINEYFDEWNEYKNQYSDDVVDEIIKDLKKYRPLIEKTRNDCFGKLPLSKDNKEKIEDFCYSLFYKDALTEFYTGIVFAGFGENDLYPTCVEYMVENCFNNHLKYKQNQEVQIDPKLIGTIIPFAQKTEVFNILRGVHPDFENQLEKELVSIYKTIDNNSGLTLKQKDKVKELLNNNFVKRSRKTFEGKHTNSIMQSVSILPKDELANMAESLVNITSFVRKVSMDIESVGGAIDVAIISKKDGFVWIKRKHYFDQKYNPQYKYSLRGEK